MISMTRRNFIKNSGLLTASVIASNVYNGCSKVSLNPRIDNIELFLLNVTKERHFSFGTWKNRQHVILKLCADGVPGYSELMISKNNPDIKLSEWSLFLNEVRGQKLLDVFSLLKGKREDRNWNLGKLEAVEMALWDVMGRVNKKPAIELLGLHKRESVPGLFCILENDPEKIKDQAMMSLRQNLNTHIKLKIFGNESSDKELIKNVCEVMGSDTYVVADANRGYKNWNNMDELAKSLIVLQKNGLNACEDPAELSSQEWVTLQKKVGELDLIPDVPLRPVWEAMNTIVPGMGKIYNLHPAGMGCLEETVYIGHKIQGWGAQIMIGDNSLIGAACTAWQQIAIGIGAVWVEALEKPQESDRFLTCIKSQATYREKDGKFGMKEKAGFGLELDEDSLKENSDLYYSI